MKKTQKSESITLPLVRDFMTKRVHTFRDDQPLEEAWVQLEALPFSGAPVVDADGKLVGMLSESDVLHAMGTAAFAGVRVGAVRDHMHPNVQSVSPSADVFGVSDALRKARHRRAPVVEDGQLIGIVTIKDCDRALLKAVRTQRLKNHKPAGAAWDPRASAERDKKRGG